MKSTLTIGEFSRATHLSLKTLRYYHRIGLLEPAAVDLRSGYRHYNALQIPTAQVIKRFRDLDMPVEEVRTLLAASLEDRARLLEQHRRRLEEELARTTAALGSIAELTTAPRHDDDIVVAHRTVPEERALAVREVVKLADLAPWFRGAVEAIDSELANRTLSPSGPAGALVDDSFFAEEAGAITVFVPCAVDVPDRGRVRSIVIPGAELAIVTHRGDHRDIDRSYGALGAHVADNELEVEGPVREIYRVGRRETPDSARWITEICWPVFRTRGA